ncbi:sulfate adenylyltransferase [Corynebacterium sp. zg-331]|uniref:sulfate adenylyltransferase subunit 1 n=1 Tax=unclassified Corynebacterium TaxID=2624378 RepID=UPI00128E354D|nr:MULTISPECIES: GTP-binding protein [unclassified Corynebacterium]MBC3185796.1 sulfate adenylyltransferase [Corynebacterium sp. zg-331]MPV52289.1 sulfate adenylyltransferase [Corynebacterium sp. zg331]
MTSTATETLSQRETLRLCTAGSVDDGKSTFVGRLLHDTKSILADQLAAVERTSADRGFDGLDLSLLVDGLRAEREQGITIDVAYRYFATPARTFILADTPGHVQYTRNTVTGMSTSQAVVLLVDARHGVVEQTRRHLTVAALLGIRHVVLAVNKIDLVDFSEEVFRGIEAEFVAFARHLGVDDPRVVPISALHGDNVVESSGRMGWYQGPTVLQVLESIPVQQGRARELPLRFPVQYVIREHTQDYRGYAGRVEAGRVVVGDRVSTPGGRITEVAHIDTADGPATEAAAGQSVVLRLSDEIDLVRGDLIAAEARPADRRSFDAIVVGLSDTALRPGAMVKLRYGTAVDKARVSAIASRVDVSQPGVPQPVGEQVRLNDIARVTVEVARPLPVEDYAARGAVGAFLLLDASSGDTLAAGLVGRSLGSGGAQ